MRGVPDRRRLSEYLEVTGARENNLQDVSVASPSGRSPCSPASPARASRRWCSTPSPPRPSASSTRRSPPSSAASCPSSASPTSTSSRTCPPPSSSTRSGSAAARAPRSAPSPTSTPLLRLLFSRRSSPHVGAGYRLLVQRPAGHVPGVRGHRPRSSSSTSTQFFDRTRSLNEGAILHPDFAVGNWFWQIYAQSGPVRQRQAARGLHRRRVAPAALRRRREGLDRRAGRKTMNADFEGVVEKFTRLFIRRDVERHVRAQPGDLRAVHQRRCPARPAHGRAAQPRPPCTAEVAGAHIAELLRPGRATLHRGAARPCDDPVAAPVADEAGRAAAAPGRHRARVPQPRPGDRHPLGRGVAAGQDGPSPREQR